MSASSLSDWPGLTAGKRAVEKFGHAESSVHAVLFYGPRGSGKSKLAQRLAIAWLGGDGSNAATAFANGRSVDVLYVDPIGPSRIIKVEQITPNRGDDKFEGTPIQEFLRTGPLQGLSKIVMIRDADRMNRQAANAVLKMLEEPPGYANFILTTSAVRSLIPTILSRCLAVPCELPIQTPSSELAVFARGAAGLVEELESHSELLLPLATFAKSLETRSRAEALLASEELKGIAESYQKATDKNARTANAEILEFLGNAVQVFYPSWYTAGTEIAEAHRRVIGNASAVLVFDNLMARILR